MKQFIIPSAIMLLLPLGMHAQDMQDVLYLNVTRNTGAQVSQRLDTADTLANPIIDFTTNRMRMGETSLMLSRVQSMSFEVKKEEVSAISDIITDNDSQGSNIYSLDGRLVRRNAVNTVGLKPGIYVMNGRKICVR